jgi:hypothetical protein
MRLILAGLVMTIAAPAAAAAQTAPPAPPAPARPPAVIAPTPTPAAPPVIHQADGFRWTAEAGVAADHAWVLQDRLFADVLRGAANSYERGKNELQRRNYEQAIAHFDRTIAEKGANVDGALYWKAFAQLKLGRTDDAGATLAVLRRDHADSRYLADAKVLEAEVRRLSGQQLSAEAIAALDDEEIKLLAISGIQQSDPEGAIPLLEGVLNAANSLAVKRRALYVLALSSQPRAREILLGFARGAGNPDLQIEAIRHLAARGSTEATSADLRQVYESTSDKTVKIAVIDAFRSPGGRLLNYSVLPMAGSVAEASAAIAATAAGGGGRGGGRSVGVGTTAPAAAPAARGGGGRGGRARPPIGRPQDLWLLYQKEPDADLRSYMVSAFASLRAVDELTQVVRTEREASVRLRAIRSLGSTATDTTVKTLVDLYTADASEDTRRAVIGALAAQDNAEALVAIARKETSIRLKTEIVAKLSAMASKSKVAADYLMEIIK